MLGWGQKMPLTRRCMLTSPLALAGLAARAHAPPRPKLVMASYRERPKALKSLTFPRLHLYDAAGRLLPREQWAPELAEIQRHAGEAFCCVSDQPAPADAPAGPPADCKRLVYGERLEEHFVGLITAKGEPLRYADLPAHSFLFVEYFADWCAPCLPARRALEAFFSTPRARDYVGLLVDFSFLSKTKQR